MATKSGLAALAGVVIMVCAQAVGLMLGGTVGQLVGFLVAVPICLLVGIWLGFQHG